MLDRARHEYYLKRILRDMIAESELASGLALKGGTCLYLFYGLPRLSVDLDFNLIGKGFEVEVVNKVLRRYVNVEGGRFRESGDGWLWEASYEAGQRHFQVDISRRKYEADMREEAYVVKQFYGLSLATQAPDWMLAYKLCAITDRPRLQNRDLYDAWFMLERVEKGKLVFAINAEVIQERTGKIVKDYLWELEQFVGRVNRAQILEGIGELLTEKQKAWVKTKLVDELLFQLRLRRESYEKTG